MIFFGFGVFCFVVSWLMPNHYPPWLSFHAEYLSAISMVLFCFGLCFDARKGWFVPWSAVFVLLLGLVPIAQYFSGLIVFSGDAYLGSAYLCVLASAQIIGGTQVLRRGEDAVLVPFFGATMAASLISCFVALAQWLGVKWGIWTVDLPPGGRPFANLAQPNLLATLLAIGLVSVFYFYSRNKIGALTSLLVAVLLAFCLALTQSRTALVFVLLFLFWLAFFYRRLGIAVNVAYVCVGVLCWVGLWFSVPFLDNALYLSTTAPLSERVTPGVRTVIWRHVLDSLHVSPWFGHGWMQISVGLSRVVNPGVWSRPIEYSHNLFLDLMAWNGFPIGLLISVAVVAWYVFRVRACCHFGVGCALLVIGLILVHSQFEYPHAYVFYLISVGLLVGAVDARSGYSGFVLKTDYPFLLSCMVACVFMWRLMTEYMDLESELRHARFVSAGLESGGYARSCKNYYILTQLRQYVVQVERVPARGWGVSEIRSSIEVSARYPSVEFMKSNIDVLLLNGMFKNARIEFDRYENLFGYAQANKLKVLLMARYKNSEGIAKEIEKFEVWPQK